MENNNSINSIESNVSNKSRMATLLFCLFFGSLGIHRFYVGKKGTGILYIFTFGLLGIGSFYDLIMIILGKFTDSKGNLVLNCN